MSPFRVVDHTADIAVTIVAQNEEELLKEGIRVLFFLFTENDIPAARDSGFRVVKKRIKLAYTGFEELFIDFLNRVLSLVDTLGLLPVGVEPRIGHSRAVMAVSFVSVRQLHVIREIKAATHHKYGVTRSAKGIRTRVTFDV